MTAHHEKLIADIESAAAAQMELERRAQIARGSDGLSTPEQDVYEWDADMVSLGKWLTVAVICLVLAAIFVAPHI